MIRPVFSHLQEKRYWRASEGGFCGGGGNRFAGVDGWDQLVSFLHRVLLYFFLSFFSQRISVSGRGFILVIWEGGGKLYICIGLGCFRIGLGWLYSGVFCFLHSLTIQRLTKQIPHPPVFFVYESLFFFLSIFLLLYVRFYKKRGIFFMKKKKKPHCFTWGFRSHFFISPPPPAGEEKREMQSLGSFFFAQEGRERGKCAQANRGATKNFPRTHPPPND